MFVYFLAEIISISDEKSYREYTEKASSIIEKHGGEYILRSGQMTHVSGDWDVQRIILIRFENREKLQKCFQSDEYKEIKHLRENSTTSRSLIIEG